MSGLVVSQRGAGSKLAKSNQPCQPGASEPPSSKGWLPTVPAQLPLLLLLLPSAQCSGPVGG